jgi:hypothetical protein
MRKFIYRLINAIRFGYTAYKNPESCFSEDNLKMVTGLFDFIMKVAVEKRPYMTKIAMITPDNESHGIVSLWAGSGASADPIDRIQELLKENKMLKNELAKGEQ